MKDKTRTNKRKVLVKKHGILMKKSNTFVELSEIFVYTMVLNFRLRFTSISTSVEIKVFMFMHLIFGNYFKSFSSKPASIILRLHCCLVTASVLVICCLNLYYLPIIHSSWTNVFEVTISFIASQLTSQKNLITFFNTLNYLDSIIGFIEKSNLMNKSFFLAFTLNVIFIVGRVIFFLPPVVAHLQFYYLSFFIVLCITTLLRYCKLGIIISLMHHRLNLLRKHLNKNDIPINIISTEGINERIHVVRKSLIYYDLKLDAFDAIDCYMQFEVILSCAFYLPKVVIWFHAWIVSYIEYHYDAYVVSTAMISMALEMILAFSPCLMMYFSNSEIDQIKKTLVLQIIRCSDVSLCEELENLLQHVTRRPFRFTLLRAVPVDLYLPVAVIANAITYVILFLQFSHFGSINTRA